MRDFVAYVRRNLPRGDVPDDRYDDVVEELASELDARYTALRRTGSSDDEAWQEVLAQVPSWPALVHDLTPARTSPADPTPASRLRRLVSPDAWRRELAVAFRMLRKDRGFAATAIITLTVCLGGHAAILGAANALLFHPLRVPEPERVLLMANQYPRVEARRSPRSAPPDYADRLQYVTALEEQALYNVTAATIDLGGIATRMSGMVATPSLFRLLRVNPTHGRFFTNDDATPGNDARVILTDGLWRESFGADPAVIGRTMRLNGRDSTIVGILPRHFAFGDPEARFWVPLVLTERERSDDARHRNGWFSVGRLKPGSTIAQVRDQLKALDAANFERLPPQLQSIVIRTGFYTSVEPLEDALVRDVRGPLRLLWAAAFAVLVIGVGNLAAVALARSRGRLGDLGTRLALGASRWDIVRQLLAEGLLIAAVGGAAALALGTWMLSAVRATQPGMGQLGIDAVAGAMTCALAALAAIVMTIASASPLYTVKLGAMLHEAVRSDTRGRAVRRAWRALIVAQMTCSFMLLVGSAVLWMSIRNLLAVDLGFRTDNVLTAVVSLPATRYADADATRAFLSRSLDSIGSLPGVAAAGATTIVPVTRSGSSGLVVAEGYVPVPGELPASGLRSVVSPGYFEALGTTLVRGRYFDRREDDPSSSSVVIDERLAQRFWPNGDAVGRRMFCPTNATQLAMNSPDTPWLTIVGVVRSARLNGPTVDRDISGTYYLPSATAPPRDFGYVIRTHGDAAGIVRDVRTAVAQIDRELPVFDIQTIAERTDLALTSRTNTMRLAMLFAAVGVFLSSLGLYGMLTYVVTQRTREIGVRLAVGSLPREIVALVLREGLWLALAGVALGAAGSVALGRLLASHLYGISPSDPRVLVAITATLAAVATVACIIPARRAAHIDVMRTLSGS
jgi:predicted permease